MIQRAAKGDSLMSDDMFNTRRLRDPAKSDLQHLLDGVEQFSDEVFPATRRYSKVLRKVRRRTRCSSRVLTRVSRRK